MSGLTRDAILAAPDRPLEAVEVPEWGGTVYVRTMGADERDAFEERLGDQAKGLRGMRALLAVLTLCDAEGARLFTEDDLPALSAKSAAVLDRIAETAMRLNGIGAKDERALAGN